MGPRYDLDRETFAGACATTSAGSAVVGAFAAIHPDPGWLVVVGALSFAALTGAMAALVSLIVAEERQFELLVEEPVPELAVAPVTLPAVPVRVEPFALLPPAPAPLLLEAPRRAELAPTPV